MGELDYPMFIVTVTHGEQRAGCLVGFATQCSIDPPRFLVCFSLLEPLRGRVVERGDGGDHELHVLEPVAAERGHRDGVFTFHRAKRIEAGHPA